MYILYIILFFQINAKLFRKVNKKFHPFLYDDTIDLCDFLKRQQKRHIFWGMVYKMLLKYSNLNHTCPYEVNISIHIKHNYWGFQYFQHTIIIDKFTYDNDVFKVLPIPKGQYKMKFLAILNGNPKVNVDFIVNRKWRSKNNKKLIIVYLLTKYILLE